MIRARLLLLFLFVMSFRTGPAHGADAEPLRVGDAAVAVVDDCVITREQLLSRARALQGERQAGAESSLSEEVIREALDQLIRERLLVAEARRLMATREAWSKRLDDLVQREQERIRSRAGGARAFQEQLKDLGLRPDEFILSLREHLMERLVLEAFVERDLSVSPEEMRARYRRDLERFRVPERVQCRQIFVSARAASDRKKALETANYLLDLLRKGHDFGRLAKQYSDGPHAADGGLWEFMTRGNWPEAIDEALFSLPVGEVAGPIEREDGFSIVKVEARRPGRLRPFEEVQEELRAELLAEKRRERERRLMERLRREHYVEILD